MGQADGVVSFWGQRQHFCRKNESQQWPIPLSEDDMLGDTEVDPCPSAPIVNWESWRQPSTQGPDGTHTCPRPWSKPADLNPTTGPATASPLSGWLSSKRQEVTRAGEDAEKGELLSLPVGMEVGAASMENSTEVTKNF